MVLCEGRRFPSHSVFSQQLCLPKITQGHHHALHGHPFLPNEHWDWCTEAEEDIQQHRAATSAPSMTAQSLSKGSTILLTLQNSSPPYEVITIEQY